MRELVSYWYSGQSKTPPYEKALAIVNYDGDIGTRFYPQKRRPKVPPKCSSTVGVSSIALRRGLARQDKLKLPG